MIKAAFVSVNNFAAASISGSSSLAQNLIRRSGSSGMWAFCTGLLNVKVRAPKVLPWNAFVQDIPGNWDGVSIEDFLHAILIAFSTASAPLLIKNALKSVGTIERSFSDRI